MSVEEAIEPDYGLVPELDAESLLAREVIRLNDIKRTISALDSEMKILSERVVKQLKADGLRIVGVTTPAGDRLNATVVTPSTREVNLVLLKELDQSLYERVTKRVVDSSALERALLTRKFTEKTINTISSKERSSYIRFSYVHESEDS